MIRDAREWLNGPLGHTLSIGDSDWCEADEDTHNDSVKIVEELYSMGAVKVEVDTYEGVEWASVLKVTMPKDKKKDNNILMYLGTLHADEMSEADGVVTVAWIS